MGSSYQDKVVLVTGSSTGLGRAIAVGAAEAGAAAVIINFANSVEQAEETARLVKAGGADAMLAQGDIGDNQACVLVAAVAERFGRIDALFNNAAKTKAVPDHGDMHALSDEDFIEIYRVNVVGTFQMIRAARSLLEKAISPAVVNTSSLAGIVGIGSSVAYAASKGALSTMTLSLARALAPKIRVNAICPGAMDTPWLEKLASADEIQKIREFHTASSPLRAVSTGEDVAGAALFLGSDAARHITGESLIVDAGMHLGYAPAKAR